MKANEKKLYQKIRIPRRALFYKQPCTQNGSKTEETKNFERQHERRFT